MQGAERREVVQATPAEGVANRAARPGVQMRYAKTPMAAEEAGRGATTLAMLAEKAQPAVQALHMQGMREDLLKGQMQFAQGKTYQQIRESGASYATVSGAAALQAQKVMNNTYLEGLTAITQEDHKLTPEQYTEKLGAISKGLFTGDQIVDDFMTELASTNVLKLAEAQTKAHEEWKVQETKSAGRDFLLSTSSLNDKQADAVLSNALGIIEGPAPKEPGNIDLFNRPRVRNADGSISTVRSTSVNIDGDEVLIPTVSKDGKLLSDKQAVEMYLDTGEHLGKFSTPQDATEYAKSLHTQQEVFYTSALGTLNTADQKEVILEAAVLDLKQGSRKIIDKLGGMQGIRDRFSTTAAEEASIIGAFAEFTSAKENEWSAEMQTDHMQNYRAVREGVITYEQGLENAQLIAQKYGKGNKTLRALAENIWGASNAYQNKMEARAQSLYDKSLRDLERAQEKALEQQELQQTAAFAVSSGTIPLLDSKGKQEALRQIQTSILAGVENDVANGSVPPGQFEQTLASRYAQQLDMHGIVDDQSAALWTANMSRMNAVVDGKVSPGTVAAFSHLVAIHKINPGLALSHLKSESAKNFFKMAVDMEEFGETTEGALLKASMAAKAEVTPQQLATRVGTSEFKKQLQIDLESDIKDTLPTLFGADRGSMAEVTPEEVARAATSPAVLNRLSRAVAVKITADPGLTDAQARSLVLQDEMQRGAYILGSWLTPKSGTLYEAMGLQGYKNETGVPMEAMTNYLAKHGPELFGKDWFNKDIFVPGHDLSTTAKGWYEMTKDEFTRSVPKVHMSMGTDADGTFFVVSPILTTGLPSNAHMVVRAKDVGKEYLEQRLTEDTDQGFISEAYGTVVRGVHSFGTAPVSHKGGGPMTKAIRDALGLTNKE